MIALQSNSTSDYIPNLTAAVAPEREHRDRGRVPAGRQPRDDGEAVPGHELRDHRLLGARGAVRRQEGHPAVQERRGPDLRGERVGLPGRRARGEGGAEGRQERRSAPSAASRSRRSTSGSRATGTARRRPSRARRCWSATRRDFAATDKCETVAQNQIGQGAQVLFQVAGGCGLGTLKAADDGGHLGHRRRRRPVQRRQARPDERGQAGRQRRLPGDPAGEGRASSTAAATCVFNLKNGGMGVGKINPAVPAA